MKKANKMDSLLYLKSLNIWPPKHFSGIYEALAFILIKTCPLCAFVEVQYTPRTEALYLKKEDGVFFAPMKLKCACPIICIRPIVAK